MELKSIGKIKRSVLERSVIREVAYNELTAVETAIGFDNVKYAFLKALNKSYIQGFVVADTKALKKVIPKYVSLGIVLPLGFEEEKLKKFMAYFKEITSKYELIITGGHTEVSDKVMEPVVTVAIHGDFASEIGMTSEELKNLDDKDETSSDEKSRDETLSDDTIYLVQTGYTGICGSAQVYNSQKEKTKEMLSESITSRLEKFEEYICIKDVAMALYAAEQEGVDIYYADSLGTGGIYEGLYDSACNTGMPPKGKGFEVDIKKIPILQETVELCNAFDINPYMMSSSGSVLVATREPNEFISILEKHKTVGSIIGILNDGNDKIVRIDDEIKYIEPFKGDVLREYI